MKKKIIMTSIASALAVLMAIPAYAGWNQDDQGWTYQNEDGSSPGIGWQWIDGKCYYFGDDGHILTNTTIPDNYQVDENGAWVIDGVVQTQGGGTVQASDDYDPQYPLRGRIEQYFSHDSEGRLIWKWDDWEFPWDYNEIVKTKGAHVYVMECAVRDRDPEYLHNYRGLEVAVLAELSGYPQTGMEYVDISTKTRLADNVSSFLNSFDFRNASDYEKAARIADWITKADYSTESDQCHFAYGALVNGYASCDGYTAAANLLATCVGLKSNGLGNYIHAYPVFLVDDIWLAYEPTIKDECFTVANVYSPGHYGPNNYMQTGEYCYATGYTIPDLSTVTKHFSDVRIGIKHGEQAAFIFFK